MRSQTGSPSNSGLPVDSNALAMCAAWSRKATAASATEPLAIVPSRAPGAGPSPMPTTALTIPGPPVAHRSSPAPSPGLDYQDEQDRGDAVAREVENDVVEQ